MILSYQSIAARLDLADNASGKLYVWPLRHSAIRPASLDVTLGDELMVIPGYAIDRESPSQHVEPVKLRKGGSWRVVPGFCYLTTISEYIALPYDLGALLCGTSTFGRLFVQLHQQAGWIDPGYGYDQDGRRFPSRPTLEISCTLPVDLYPGDPIGQLLFVELDHPTTVPYGHPVLRSRYNGDFRPTAAKTDEPDL
jgi:deoxycytidine triphosphate deaminase